MTDHDGGPSFAVRTPLAGTAAVATVAHGVAPGVVMRERHAGGVLRVAAFRGTSGEVMSRLADVLGIETPAAPAIAIGTNVRVVWSGPGQWLVMTSGAGSSSRLALAAEAVTGLAAAVELSSARVLLALAGPDVRRALAKVLAIDLHPAAFPAGAAAMTELAHVAVHVWRLPDRDGHAAFEIAAPRSFAGSVWQALADAAAEYGLDAEAL